MSMVENNGNWNELTRERNVALSGKFLALLREFHPEREVFGPEPAVEVVAPEPWPEPTPVAAPLVRRTINVRALNPIDTIARSACAHFNMTLAALLSERRDRESVRARHIVMYLTKRLTTVSLPNIGRRMGGLDHTTILHGVRKITERMTTDQALFDDVAAVQARAIAVDPALGALV